MSGKDEVGWPLIDLFGLDQSNSGGVEGGVGLFSREANKVGT